MNDRIAGSKKPQHCVPKLCLQRGAGNLNVTMPRTAALLLRKPRTKASVSVMNVAQASHLSRGSGVTALNASAQFMLEKAGAKTRLGER